MFFEGLEHRQLMANDFAHAIGPMPNDHSALSSAAMPLFASSESYVTSGGDDAACPVSPCSSTTVEAAVATPTAGWKLQIEEVYRFENQLWVLSSLQKPAPSRAVAQFLTRASDQVAVASESLPTHQFVVSPTLDIHDDGVANVADVNEFHLQFSRVDADLLFSRNQRPVVAEALADVSAEEDAPQRVISLAHVFIDSEDGSNLALTVSSDNQELVATSLNGTDLLLQFGENQHGTATITVTASDSAGFTATDEFAVEVASINDGPRVTMTPGTVSLTDASPTASIDLATVFSDVDDVTLNYRLVSSDAELIAAEIAGTRLQLTAAANRSGEGTVVIEARDAAGRVATVDVSVSVGQSNHATYLIVADQVLDYRGRSVVTVRGAARFKDVSVTATNEQLLPPEDVSVRTVGSDLEVEIQHRSNDYGMSAITLSNDGLMIAEFSAIVLPPSDVTRAEAGTLNLNVDLNEGVGNQTLSVSYNDRALAYLVRQGAVTSSDAVALSRPTNHNNGLDPVEFTNSHWQTVHATSAEDGSRTTQHAYTYYGSVSETAVPDVFDRIDSGLQAVAHITDVIDKRFDNVADNIIDKAKDKSIEAVFKHSVQGINLLIDAIDPENDIDLNPAGDLVWGVTSLMKDFGGLAIELVKPSPDKSDIVFASIQFTSSLVSLANTVRHMAFDKSVAAVADSVAESATGIVGGILSRVAELGASTGLNEAMAAIPATSQLGSSLKGYANKSVEAEEVLDAGSETYQKIALAKEYITTGIQIADHIEAIWKELFGPSDLYVDKDGVERSWGADQHRYPTPGKDNATTGSGDNLVESGAGNDKIQTNSGNDRIFAGAGDNRIDAGSGADFIRDGGGDSFIRAGSGADEVEDYGGNDVINLGPGQDTLIYRSLEIGRDLVYDVGRSGEIQLLAISQDDISYAKRGNDLAISIAKSGVALNDEIRIVDFFRNEVTDWALRTKDGPVIDLRTVTGRLSHQNSARLALESYREISTYVDSLPAGLHHTATVTDASTGLNAEVFMGSARDGSVGTSHAYVVIRGSEVSLQDWLINNTQAGLPQANALISALNSQLTVEQLQSITLVGHSAGGMVAQWAGTYFASRQIPFVNVTTLNSPEISGRIQSTLMESFEEYAYGLPNLSATHIIDVTDPVSKLGFWAGRGLGTSTWVTWSSSRASSEKLLTLSELLAAHTPSAGEFSGGEVEFTILTPEQVQRHVGIRGSEDSTKHLYRVDLQNSTTQSLFDLLLAGGLVELEGDEVAIVQHEQQFTQSLAHDPGAGVMFSKKFDFGPIESNVEPGYDRISENTRYITGAGWLEVNADLTSQDRGRATDLQRDFVATSGNTFVVDLPSPGTYNISFVTGDRNEIRESMVYYVNGFYYDTISTMPGQFLTHGFQITTSDPQLRLEIKDRGGETTRAVINGLTVDKVPFGVDAPASTIVQDDASLIVLTHGYTIPGWVENAIESVKQTIQAGKDVAAVVGAYGRGGPALAVLKATEITLRRVREELTKDTSVRATSRVDDWVFEAADAFAAMSRRFRLGQLDSNVVPVDFDAVWNAIQSGKSDKQLLKLWKGSRDFLAIDWTDESSEGSGFFDLVKGDFSEEAHRDAVEHGAQIYKALIDALIAELRSADPDRKLDVLLVSHSYGYNVNRELAERISYSQTSDAVDFLKLVTLDPVSMKPDELRGTNRQSDRLNWYHPELTPEVDAIDNYYQTVGVFHTKFTSVALGFGLIGAEVHRLAGNIEDQIVFGKPLDGLEGGGVAGFYNRQARVFDLASLDEILRFRHWDTNEISLTTAELTDIEFSPDGTLVAASGKDGIVTVRYVDDVPNPDPSIESPLYPAGKVKFEVWGNESIVRSVAFMQLEVDGVWKDYLLTISAARNPENTDIDKNKVLLTDVESGQPVWQGKDIGGTQVEASPSGEIIVSADSNGHAKIWKRVPGTVTYAQYGELVDAHPNGAYIADLYVINDQYFVTAGLDSKLKLFEITDDGAKVKWSYRFDNPGEGKVRNLDYDPYNGILAVASGQELSFWRFDQTEGTLSVWGPEGQPADNVFGRQDHTKNIQGVSFSKPSFLLDDEGHYLGDRHLPHREGMGDIDLAAIQRYIADNHLPDSLAGLKLVTGGEDRTLFLYALDDLDIGSLPKESVLSGAMLPIREVTLSPDGKRVAVVGQDNVEDEMGGPVRDINVTDEIDKRLGFKWSDLFVGGFHEHTEVPPYYLEDVVGVTGESYFWQRNNDAASRSGDLDPSRNLALPPNKRSNSDELDIEPINLQLRPADTIDVKPLRYLIEVDREDYHIDEASLALLPAVVRDADNNVIGELRQKRNDGKLLPNVLVFEAAKDLDFAEDWRSEYTGRWTVTLTGSEDAEGVARTVPAEISIHVINHKPVLNRDVVDLHPNRSELDFRPKQNDYDFDNDDFPLYNIPTAWQSVPYHGETVVRYRKTEGNGVGIDIETVVSEERLAELLAAQAAATPEGDEPLNYINVSFDYQTRETKYKAVSTGTIEVRLQLQAGPENIRNIELGADQFVIQWDPVSWNATKYVIQRFDEAQNIWVRHADNSEVSGQKSDSAIVKNLQPQTDYWFRVVAVNENNGRRHASYEGIDKEGGFHVVTPDYEATTHVAQEVLGPGQVEVSWNKVYWDVAKYVVELRKLVRLANGEFAREADGSWQYSEIKTHEVVPGENNGRGLSWVFKKLEPDSFYLASVTAKRGATEVTKDADYPVSTATRLVPAALDAVRIGPQKVKLTWSKVSFADRYRIIAIDPSRPLERNEVAGFDATPGQSGTRTEVITGLDAETEYVLFVEARDRFGHWSSVLPKDDSGLVVKVLENGDVPEGQSQFDLSDTEAGADRFRLTNDFDSLLRLPSREGYFVNTERFSVVNLSHHRLTLQAYDGELINGSSFVTVEPAVGTMRSDENPGIVVYRFVATESGWRFDAANSASEATRVETPPFLAAEAGSFQKNEEDSLPKQLKVNWESPFWNVEKHRVQIFEAIVGADGLPLRNEDGTYQRSAIAAAPSVTKYLDTADDRYFGTTFTGLKPNTHYVAVLTTSGPGHNATEELLTKTDSRTAPTGVGSRDVTLDSFIATWTPVNWNVQGYRVALLEMIGNGWQRIRQDDPQLQVSENKSQVRVTGLESGKTYRFTIEADSGAAGWLENTPENTAEVRIPQPSDLAIRGLVVDAARNRQLDLSWEALGFTPDSLFFEITAADQNDWHRPDAGGANITRTSKTLEGLELNTSYDIRLVAMVTPSNGIATRVESKFINASTSWGINNLDRNTPTEVRVEFPRMAAATKYDLVVYVPGGNTVVQTKTIDQGDANPRLSTITGLAPNTSYELEVVARNGSTVLARSERSPFATTAAAPASGLVTSDVRKQQIDLQWNALSWTPEAQFIEVTVSGVNQWSRPTGSGVMIGNTTNTISELAPGTSYDIRLVATLTLPNGTEYRAVSEPITRTTESYPPVPGVAVDQQSPTSARANWNQLGEGSVTDYRLKVYLHSNGSFVTEKTVGVGSGSRSSTITGLAQGTSYDLVIEALDGSTVIATSTRVQFSTLTAQAATGLTTSAVRKQELDLSWNALNWTPESQFIEVSISGTGIWVRPEGSGVAIGRTTNTISKLAPGTTYDIRHVATLTLSDGTEYRAVSPIITRVRPKAIRQFPA